MVARGAIDAGCLVFSGYPITPSSEIYQVMIESLPERGGLALAASDEITAIAQCVGASLAGYKAMTATSGPGWCLMTETIQYAVMTETPVVVAVVQRLGPSTGGATQGGQGDVLLTEFCTSGGYTVPVFAPSSAAECYALAHQAFHWSERLRTPVVLLSDKEVGMTLESVSLEEARGSLCDAPHGTGSDEAPSLEKAGTGAPAAQETVEPGGLRHDHGREVAARREAAGRIQDSDDHGPPARAPGKGAERSTRETRECSDGHDPLRSRAARGPTAMTTERRSFRGGEGRFLPYASPCSCEPPDFAPVGGPVRVVATGSAHDREGRLRKNAPEVIAILERLQSKIESHAEEMALVKGELAERADTLIVSYGITARAAWQASRTLRRAGRRVSMLQLLTLFPVPVSAIERAARGCARIVVAEENLTGLYASVLEPRVGSARLVRVNGLGRMITPTEIAGAAESA